ncbi:MAG: DNA-protecting protein DprA [Bacteroidetes bacterium]|nr:DNA-protecting protein DprA [Bacteroidota bacterium]
MNVDELRYRIALTFIPGIGNILAKNLISYCGTSEAVFKEKKKALMKIPGIGFKNAMAVLDSTALEKAESEIEFIREYNITSLFYLDKDYPQRLRNCEDGPILLFYKGNVDLNTHRVISVVGTRNATHYGKGFLEKFVSDIAEFDLTLISGLAYGIDVFAHKMAVKNGIPTLGILGHGLDFLYPTQHSKLAKKIITHGGLISEYPSLTSPDRENFPKRNRIIAGMCDAVIVVETKERGGSMITAEIANSYNRDVFAVPGRIDDEYSSGCNRLLKNNKASMLESAHDLAYLMGWEQNKKSPGKQIKLLLNLTSNEKKIVDYLQNSSGEHIDRISLATQLSVSQTASVLLNLELSNVVKCLPGKQYLLV